MNYTSGLFSNTNHLGAFNPFYFIDDSGKFIIRNSLDDIMAEYTGQIEIDMGSAICVLNKNYMFGDKTIIKGIYRAPWMAKPNNHNNQWNYHTLPSHGQKIKSQVEIADEFFRLLCEEVKTYIGKNKSIGILLSGGMDSRVVAGIIKHLIDINEISINKVVAYTWGENNSRDVVYAKEITLQLGWEWRHYEVGSKELWRNIVLSSERGCEYSGIHLHAIPDIAIDAEQEVDVILAGSYGDSVGRAEFSGRHITQLFPIEKGLKNFGQLINSKIYKKEIHSIVNEIERYHSLFPRDKYYQQMELDYQLHYMRRMLNPCMEVINEKVPLHQVFTAPDVFGYLWSLNPKYRGNDLYKEIFNRHLISLKDIPWARTGLKYGECSGIPDSYSKAHHNYGYFLQNSLSNQIKDAIESLSFPGLNKYCIERIHKNICTYQNFNFDYLEALSWVISFGLFMEKHNIAVTDICKNTKSIKMVNLFKVDVEYNIKRKGRQLKSRIKG